MREELKSGILQLDDLVEKFENGEITFVALVSNLWYKGYKKALDDSKNIVTFRERKIAELVEAVINMAELYPLKKGRPSFEDADFQHALTMVLLKAKGLKGE